METDRKTRAAERKARRELRQQKRQERIDKHNMAMIKAKKIWIVFAAFCFTVGFILFLAGLAFNFSNLKFYFVGISFFSYLTWSVCCIIAGIFDIIYRFNEWGLNTFGDFATIIVIVFYLLFGPLYLVCRIIKNFKWLHDAEEAGYEVRKKR
jgi:ABC-type multidrug transport system fused ATPase/permease subunit